MARFLLAKCGPVTDRKSTRLNSSHRTISYAVFCLKKKKKTKKCNIISISSCTYYLTYTHLLLFSLQCYLPHPHLHSFPTRRSSDLHSHHRPAHQERPEPRLRSVRLRHQGRCICEESRWLDFCWQSVAR